jgi:DNA/RNA-binding domain of Phe-tRNA-synthetase-like protein
MDRISIQAQEEVEQIEEAVDAIGQLQKIKDTHQHGTVNHKDGSASKVDAQTAHAVLMVHKSLNDVNKKKFSDMMARSSHHMQKAAEFSWKQMK